MSPVAPVLAASAIIAWQDVSKGQMPPPYRFTALLIVAGAVSLVLPDRVAGWFLWALVIALLLAGQIGGKVAGAKAAVTGASAGASAGTGG